MKLSHLLIACLLPSLGFAAETVETRMVCDDTKKIVSTLKEQYKEDPIAIGRATDEAASIMTLWVNPNNMSWTILATKNEVSCIIGFGSELKLITRKPYI